MISDYTSSPTGLPFTQGIYSNFTPELHWSQNMTIDFVLCGSLDIHYGGYTRHFIQNDIFFFLPFETLSVVMATPDTRLLRISVDADFLTKLIPDFSSLVLRQHHVEEDFRNPLYRCLCHTLASIVFLNTDPDTCAQIRMLESATGMLSTILKEFAGKSDTSRERDYTTTRINDILSYIHNHYTEKIRVSDIASHLGIHPQYFSSFFTKHFHTGFSEYLASYRVNASLNRLLFTDANILNIALENGFSNHKTYGTAFRKLYGMSPTEFRKSYHRRFHTEEPTENADEIETGQEPDLFAFLRQFLSSDTAAPTAPFRTQTLNFHPEKLLAHSQMNHHIRACSVGRAMACLRQDLQTQIREAKEDLNIDHFRVRDIFSDALYIYYENENHEPVFNWQALDNAFDFILSTGAKPFPEIGYMPEKLASRKQYAGLQFHPNVSAPKSMQKWQSLVRSFLLHYIDRYGMEEISEWYFDFWTSPDLVLKMAYWYETMEDFFDFYRCTWEVFQDICPSLKLGSPNFSTMSGFPWYHAFFQYCRKHNITPPRLHLIPRLRL